jgi:transposase InsO family protein
MIGDHHEPDAKRATVLVRTVDAILGTHSNGTQIIKNPVRSSRANSFAERYAGTLRRECLGHLLIHGEQHLRQNLAEYSRHYNVHRPHQSREQRPPRHEPGQAAIDLAARIKRRQTVQGLISEYRRAA